MFELAEWLSFPYRWSFSQVSPYQCIVLYFTTVTPDWSHSGNKHISSNLVTWGEGSPWCLICCCLYTELEKLDTSLRMGLYDSVRSLSAV